MLVQTKHRFSVKEYGNKTVLHAGSQAVPLAFPDDAVDVAELLKR